MSALKSIRGLTVCLFSADSCAMVEREALTGKGWSFSWFDMAVAYLVPLCTVLCGVSGSRESRRVFCKEYFVWNNVPARETLSVCFI